MRKVTNFLSNNPLIVTIVLYFIVTIGIMMALSNIRDYCYNQNNFILTNFQVIKTNFETEQEQITTLQKQIEQQNELIKKQQKDIDNLKQFLPDKARDIYETSRGGERFIASAYTADDAGCNRITATGTYVQEGRTIATDNKVIPTGSLVYIESDYPGVTGIYKAEDVGGGINGNRIDIYMEERSKAFDFGRRDIKVKVLGG